MSKNKSAVALGRRGGQATAAKLTPEERKESARQAATARWADHEPSATPSARSHRKRRTK